ncbi:MAG: ATP phosphoribosyltransferase [Bacteroidota bacterium]|nr:ATP phosphoribosyltransferase [Bacteroidota bacterium]
MLYVALPNKGVLSKGATDLILAAGYHCSRSAKELRVRDVDNQVSFFFLRPRDIATYVSQGVLDLGITARDLLLDSGAPASELLALDFGRARLCYAAPESSDLSLESLDGQRIATSFNRLVAADLSRRKINASLVHLDGAVEISIQLGVADVVADLVQTGRTLIDAGLKIIGDPVLETEAILIARSKAVEADPAVRLFLQRLRGILVARQYIMVEYDCPRVSLAQASAITPGIESPTVIPLSKSDWVSIKAMARRNDANRIMDELEQLGARGILITEIRTCRI